LLACQGVLSIPLNGFIIKNWGTIVMDLCHLSIPLNGFIVVTTPNITFILRMLLSIPLNGFLGVCGGRRGR